MNGDNVLFFGEDLREKALAEEGQADSLLSRKSNTGPSPEQNVDAQLTKPPMHSVTAFFNSILLIFSVFLFSTV